jgi:hypothetical protein
MWVIFEILLCVNRLFCELAERILLRSPQAWLERMTTSKVTLSKILLRVSKINYVHEVLLEFLGLPVNSRSSMTTTQEHLICKSLRKQSEISESKSMTKKSKMFLITSTETEMLLSTMMNSS